jgi:hypothetical protein
VRIGTEQLLMVLEGRKVGIDHPEHEIVEANFRPPP